MKCEVSEHWCSDRWLGLPWWFSSKESACNAGDTDLIPGLRRSPGEGTHFSILSWEIPWTEEPFGLQSMGSQKSWTWSSNEITMNPCFLEKYRGDSCESLVTTFLSMNGSVYNLIYACFYLKKLHLICIVDSLILNSRPKAL